jgi:glucokinase
MYLGIAVGNILGVISPQRVIFGGGVSSAGDLLLRPLVRTVNARVHVVPVSQVDFVLAELGNHGGVIGAALWAKRKCEG